MIILKDKQEQMEIFTIEFNQEANSQLKLVVE